jgi:hypothetical protein
MKARLRTKAAFAVPYKEVYLKYAKLGNPRGITLSHLFSKLPFASGRSALPKPLSKHDNNPNPRRYS